MSQTLKVSEIFESIQGEGPSAGVPATFVRLAGCNLRCSWCDTPYSWDWSQFPKSTHVQVVDIASLAERLATSQRLIITGGEPLLQQTALIDLLQRLDARLFIEVETNGTLLPEAELLERVQQWNVSPKLANSGESTARRLNEAALRALAAVGGSWLKLVVSDVLERDEFDALIDRIGWPKSRVCLQPEARDRIQLQRAAPVAASLCLATGYRYSPRLHLELWDGAPGH